MRVAKINFSILCLFLFILCCILGVWQLQRYQFKKQLLTAYTTRIHAVPRPIMEVLHVEHDLQFQPVIISGNYIAALTVFIQNQPQSAKNGYEMLTPLQIYGEKKLLLIDRGKVQKPDQALPVPTQIQHIIGYIKLVNEYQFILGKNILNPNTKPLVLQKVNIDEISQMTNQAYFPFVIKTAIAESNSTQQDWIMTTVVPQRHMAYAIQWFLFALIIVISYMCFIRGYKKDDK